MATNTSILDCDMNISSMRKATEKVEPTWTGKKPVLDDSYLEKVASHSINTDDFTHYKIEYTREEKVKCNDDGEHPTVYYHVPKGGSVKCGYCNRMWIRK